MSLPPSLWADLAAPIADFAPPERSGKADLVIVGAGFLGLSTALRGAQAGLDVRLIEAAQPGFGASGRNTGFVVPSLKSGLGPAETRALLGDTHAARLLRLVAGSGDAVFGLIAKHDIDAAASQSGWLQPGHSAQAEDMLRGRLAALRDSGVDVDFIDRAAMRATTGLPGIYGGLRCASGGQLNPLAYARGLARAAAAAGATIHGDTPVAAIQPIGAGWRVLVGAHHIDAPAVLLSTNAMVGALCPQMRQSIVPVKVYQIATQPLDADIRTRILPDCGPVADTRRHTFALRWSEDHRLLTGGMVPLMPGRAQSARRRFTARIAAFAPDLPPLRAEYLWSGTIAATTDALPRMIRVAPGLHGVIGCNGRGVALASALGQEIGAFLAGALTEANFVLPITPPRPVPFSRLSGLGPHLWLPWSELRDRIEARPNRKEAS